MMFMEKPAKTKYDIHPLIKRRWSPRAFSDNIVEKEKLQRIFEAARWAPSSFNQQPWKYIVGVKGSDSYNKIIDTLIEFNRQWAKLAPVLVMVIGKKVDQKNRPNLTYQYDTGQSVAYLTLQAMHEGLFMHQMGGFKPSKASEYFSIDDEHDPIVVFAIGYIASYDRLPEKYQEIEKAERTRKNFDEFVFENKFGKKSEIF